MIIWGSRNRKKQIGYGMFHCPHCNAKRSYEHLQYKQWFTLYFIPVFPMRDLGEVIECTTCRTPFKVEVLTYKPKPQPVDLKAHLNQLKSTLESGLSVEYAVRDLTAAGLEREIALGAVRTAIGDTRQFCPTCELHYASTVRTCRECGGVLQPKTG